MKRSYLCAVFLAFCAAQAELPPLIPRQILFSNPARTDPKVSPDGSQLSWLAPDKSNTLNVWTSALDGTNAHCVTNETGDPIEWYTWDMVSRAQRTSSTTTVAWKSSSPSTSAAAQNRGRGSPVRQRN